MSRVRRSLIQSSCAIERLFRKVLTLNATNYSNHKLSATLGAVLAAALLPILTLSAAGAPQNKAQKAAPAKMAQKPAMAHKAAPAHKAKMAAPAHKAQR